LVKISQLIWNTSWVIKKKKLHLLVHYLQYIHNDWKTVVRTSDSTCIFLLILSSQINPLNILRIKISLCLLCPWQVILWVKRSPTLCSPIYHNVLLLPFFRFLTLHICVHRPQLPNWSLMITFSP
jgi:hypothetical protein